MSKHRTKIRKHLTPGYPSAQGKSEHVHYAQLEMFAAYPSIRNDAYDGGSYNFSQQPGSANPCAPRVHTITLVEEALASCNERGVIQFDMAGLKTT